MSDDTQLVKVGFWEEPATEDDWAALGLTMTGDDRVVFAQGLTLLSELFNQPMSEMRAEAYWLALKNHLSVQEFRQAVIKAMQASRFLPTPHELLELAGTTAADRARRDAKNKRELDIAIRGKEEAARLEAERRAGSRDRVIEETRVLHERLRQERQAKEQMQ